MLISNTTEQWNTGPFHGKLKMLRLVVFFYCRSVPFQLFQSQKCFIDVFEILSSLIVTHNKCIKCNSTCNGMFALMCFSDTFNFISSFHKIFLFRLYALPPPPTAIIPPVYEPTQNPLWSYMSLGPGSWKEISAKNGRINFFFHFLYLPPYALPGAKLCVIISFFQSKGTTVFCCRWI